MKTLTESYDIVVCGGGLAGTCAAIAAARHGAKVCLVQDRPVLGGNSSSEIRVTPHGAGNFHAYARETGIISEALIEERAQNHQEVFENGWTNSVWDTVLYDIAIRTPGLTLRVNTTVDGVIMADGSTGVNVPPDVQNGYAHRPACNTSRRIAAVTARVANAETLLRLNAAEFVDCTGDASLADWAGCEWRMGTESRAEFNEPHAPAEASTKTMGNSIHFRARDMGKPVPFKAPDWAVKHENPDFFYKQGRGLYDMRGGYWWIEIGMPWDTIYDAETIRHELTRHTLGIWDWIKNRDPKTKAASANYAIDWIGQVPGKRESRRVIGQYFLTEHSIAKCEVFPDEIAFGGWFIDLHTPGGLLAPTAEPASAEGYNPNSEYAEKSYVGPYGIPLRCLHSKDIENLSMAGRNVSATHAALGTVRVMATTALLGQALGTELALRKQGRTDITDLKQTLLRDGCFLPNSRNQDPADLARLATVTASSEASLYGAGPETRGADIPWASHNWDSLQPIDRRIGQPIALGAGGRLDTVSFCLRNASGQTQSLAVELVGLPSAWHYQSDTGTVHARATLQVPVGEAVWVDWPVQLTGLPSDCYARLDLLPNPALIWLPAATIVPGHIAMADMGRGKMRRYQWGLTQSFRVSPAQRAYPASNVISGVTRPLDKTHLWRSDPAQPLPQWIALTWETAQTIQQIEVTFSGNLVKEYHAYPPFCQDPQTVKDYTIEAQDAAGHWSTLLVVSGNYQRHNRHALPAPVTATQLRLRITATNGDPSAAVYEIRCYAV